MGFWKKIIDDIRFKLRKSKSQKHSVSVESTEAVSGIYKLIDTEDDPDSTLIYIGESGDIAKRINQHLSKKKLDEKNIENVEFKEVEGDKLEREIEEQKGIDKYGVLPNQKLTNKKNPVSKARRKKNKAKFDSNGK